MHVLGLPTLHLWLLLVVKYLADMISVKLTLLDWHHVPIRKLVKRCFNVSRVCAHLLRVWRVVEHHGRRHWRHGISKCSQLLLTMSIAAVIGKLTNTRLLEIATYLSLVVGQQGSYILAPRKILRHGVVNVTLLGFSVCEGAHLTERAGFGLLVVLAESGLVF